MSDVDRGGAITAYHTELIAHGPSTSHLRDAIVMSSYFERTSAI
jgi:hypothetical protein